MPPSFVPSEEFIKAAFNENVAHNLALLDSGRYSDLTIRCGDRKWTVHKSIICPKSDYFAKAAEGHFQESTTGIISLQEENPAIVHKMVQYLYTGTYDDELDEWWGTTLANRAELATNPEAEAVEAETWPEAPLSNVDVYVMGDKYLIPGLKKLSLQRLKDWTAGHEPSRESSQMVEAIYAKAGDVEEMKEVAIDLMMGNYPNLLRDKDWDWVLRAESEILVDLLAAGALKVRDLESENARMREEWRVTGDSKFTDW